MLNLGGEDVDTATQHRWPMLFAIMSALAQMERGNKRGRFTDSANSRQRTGLDLGSWTD